MIKFKDLEVGKIYSIKPYTNHWIEYFEVLGKESIDKINVEVLDIYITNREGRLIKTFYNSGSIDSFLDTLKQISKKEYELVKLLYVKN